MNQTLRFAAIAALLLTPASAQRAAQPAAAPKQQNKAQAAAKSSAVPNTLPAGAEKIGEYKWKHKDASGKTWIYVQTPFGYSKVDEETDAKQSAGKESSGASGGMIRVVDQTPEQVTFEMTTPFGKQRWQKKRAELEDKEKAALRDAALAADKSKAQ